MESRFGGLGQGQGSRSQRLVDSLSAAPKDSFLWDLDVKGFGLKITPKGRKVYIVQKRLNGHLRRFTIGLHGAPWTPDNARVEANNILAALSSGIDPNEEKRKAQADLTVAELCDLHVNEGCGTKKASTMATDRGRIERHIKPLLGKKKLRPRHEPFSHSTKCACDWSSVGHRLGARVQSRGCFDEVDQRGWW